ncbi:1-phosphatidylinositol 4,5-bisphosphate phosphodiesterase beta-3 [Halotydeus destructor]|nr:1-phosphatidylinositol 4,5-bisphosphate phosphodiesterase beta-3 [Halotydeus destructor]
MASAKAGVHVIQLKPISVPLLLQDGYKFVKWDDDSTTGTPVTLRIDSNGFFLYWTDQNNETEFLDISSIRDTRSGRGARTPRDGKLRDTVNMGAEGQLEDKTVTVVYGPDFVNVNYINFCCNSKDVASEWAFNVLRIAYNLLALNGSAYMFMIKVHAKISLMKDRDGKVPVKNIVKMFAQHKDDKKRVEKALEQTDLPHGKNDSLNPDDLTLDKFLRFTKNLVARNELDSIFEHFSSAARSGSKTKQMTVDELVKFLNLEQRDPRLNEILHPYADRARGLEIISMYEPNQDNVMKGLLSVEGFLRYLMSDDNAVVAPEKFDMNQDMDQSMNHYFINSSHNTYLTGHQLTGKSSVEIYRQCLLAGCRCIELDCWNGRGDDEPIITHGYTVVTDVLLKDVLEAIAETAFKTSEYPVILSFENHCSPKQQAKIAHYCRKIFGDMLLTETLPSFPLKPEVPLPSPKLLMRKIIIKNKKKHHHPRNRERKARSPGNGSGQPNNITCSVTPGENVPADALSSSAGGTSILSTPEKRANFVARNSDESSHERTLEREDSLQLNDSDDCASISNAISKPTGPAAIGASSCDIEDVDSESSGDEDDAATAEVSLSTDRVEQSISGEVVASQHAATAHIKETEAGAEMSALVLYMQPVRFHSFEHAEKRKRSYEISSFVETHATSLLKERPVDFVNFNKRQMSRIYPKGTRVDSSNYMPQVFWNAGCQMVALNFQTLDLGMQLNLGIFEYNGRSGYLLKPDFMRRSDRKFDPFTESTVDGIIAGCVAVRIISGQFLSDKRTGTYVEVDMFGLPADSVRRKRTRTIANNGINPVYGDELFIFKKVVLPELASLRIAAYEESGKLIGHRVLPVVGLRPGYRHISLRNEASQPLLLPSLFVHIQVKDYVPDGLSELADALANPIAYQSETERRANQLQALTDDSEMDRPVSDICVHETSSTSKVAAVHSEPADKRLSSQACASPLPTAGGPSGHSAGQRTAGMKSDAINANSSCRPSTQSFSSPAHPTQVSTSSPASSSSSVPPLLRQDTFTHSRVNPTRIPSDEVSGDRIPSLLESAEAQLSAEPVDRLREHKSVHKVVVKMEKELQSLRKKNEKHREKEISLIQQKEEKIIHGKEKHKSMLTKTHSRLSKKSSSTDASGHSAESPVNHVTPIVGSSDMPSSSSAPAASVAAAVLEPNLKMPTRSRTRRQSLQYLVSSVPSLHRNILKRKSELDLQHATGDQQGKIDELYRFCAQNLFDVLAAEMKAELSLREKYHDQLYSALEKVMQCSQAAQNVSLQSLHDQEVSNLMKRLEAQNKEDLSTLGKKHKDKNELARIKRELQQRLIEQAVSERSRLKIILEKRKIELEARHEEVRLKFEQEKRKEFDRFNHEYRERMDSIQEEYNSSAISFVTKMMSRIEKPVTSNSSSS